jgi:hypothetical protein
MKTKNIGLNVSIRRDSVCQADDIFPVHLIKLKLKSENSIEELCEEIIKMEYLPLIGGNKATWILRNNEIIIAVFAQQWPKPKYLFNRNGKLSELELENKTINLNFEYCKQINPEYKFRKLKQKMA